MKINLILPHQLPFPPVRGGGVEHLNWLLARQFARRGHQVVAYSRAVPELPDRETDGDGIRHVRVRGYDRHPNRWIDHMNARRYARNVSAVLEPADLSSFHTPFSFLLRRKAGVGVCAHTIHRTPKWPLPLYRKMDRLYCGSDAVLAQAREIDGRLTTLKRIYNCIALGPEAPRGREGEGNEGLKFLYVGRFVADKGIESLVKGFELTRAEFPANRLETVGPISGADGADYRFYRRISQYVKGKGLEGAVSMRGPIFDKTQLNAVIGSADVICVPSLGGETFSMAILEAMAMAKPVLVSDFSPMPEAVDHLVTGYVARAGDAGSIRVGIRFFSENRGRIAEMGQAAFNKAAKCFSVERIAAEYVEDFEALIRGKAGSPKVMDPRKVATGQPNCAQIDA
jgi:glycosyltransferase involved in cell wall biosynthesis